MSLPQSLHRLQVLVARPLVRQFAYCLSLVAAWRVLLQGYAVFVLNRFPLTDTISQPKYWLTMWYTYDGHHYISIAQKGYEVLQYAFFPLFPLAIRLVAQPAVWLFGDRLTIFIVAGLIVTSLSLAGALFFLLEISKTWLGIEAGRRAIFLLLFFPAAIFLGAVYTESFFLLWSVGAFYFAHRRNWVWAGLFGMMAAGTRLVGVWLFPCLLLEFILAYRHEWQLRWRQAWPLLLIPVSLGLYMVYQWKMAGSPFQFLYAEQAWDRHITLWSVAHVYHELIHGLNLFKFDAGRIAPLYDGLATVVFAVLTVRVLVRRQWVYGLYMVLLLISPLVSGTDTGMIRYVIVIFPGFLLLGWWTRRQTVYSLLLAAFAIFFSILSIHYLNTWWLA